MSIEIENIIKGTVVKILDYGAIVRLDAATTGLIHISEIADSYVQNIRDYINENDEVTVKILRLVNKGRYELSIKQCEPKQKTDDTKAEPVVIEAQHAPSSRRHEALVHVKGQSFEDKLSHYLKESEDRQHELKRSVEGKRKRKRK